MKKVSLEMTDEQYDCYQKAADKLLQMGIPVSPKNIILVLITNRDEEQVTADFMKMMKSLINGGKKNLTRRSANDAN